MFGLKQSKVIAVSYTLLDIPNKRNVKVAVHDDGDYITLVGRSKFNKGWYRLGDREDLKPKCLKDFGLTSCRSADKNEQEEFVKKVVKIFGK